jgi:hypothetical protein
MRHENRQWMKQIRHQACSTGEDQITEAAVKVSGKQQHTMQVAVEKESGEKSLLHAIHRDPARSGEAPTR